MYRVDLADKKVRKQLDNLPKTIFNRITSALQSLEQEARPRGSRKLKGYLNVWRFRVGDYRILYDIDDEKKIVLILEIRHRREAYR